jgi:hypothetical protein
MGYQASERRVEEKTWAMRAEALPPSSITAAEPGGRSRISSGRSRGALERVRVQRPSLE